MRDAGRRVGRSQKWGDPSASSAGAISQRAGARACSGDSLERSSVGLEPELDVS
jgi:hypothetical protein